MVHTNKAVCKQVNIAGLSIKERTIFAFIMAQYLSLSGKTLIIEKDFDYLILSNIANKSKADFLEILAEDIYENAQREILRIRNSDKKLIVIGTRKRVYRDYGFICSLLYNNLIQDIAYLVKENDFEELSDSAKYIVVLPNNTVDLLKTAMAIPVGYEYNARYVGVDILRIQELAIQNSKQMEIIIRDVLQIRSELHIPIFNISSLRLGGEPYDLHMLIE